MAITNIHPIKKTLGLAIDYIINTDKTDGQILVSSNNCMAETASIEFKITQDQAQKGKVLAHHLIQSFQIEEIKNPQLAHDIGMKLAKEVLGDKHEFVLATHIDKKHVHNHIIFNSVNIADKKHYRSNIKSYYSIREKSDRLCKENNLSVIHDPQKTRKTKDRNKNLSDNKELTVRDKIKIDIDNHVRKVFSVDELYKKLVEMGYKIKQGKHTVFYSPYSERGMRDNKLDDTGLYTKAFLENRISRENPINEKAKSIIDNALEKSASYNDFLKNVKLSGALIRQGESYSIKVNESDHYLKESILGKGYTTTDIKEFIDDRKNAIATSQTSRTDSFSKLYKLTDQMKCIEDKINEENKKRNMIKRYLILKPIIEKGRKSIFFDSYKKKNNDSYIEFEALNIKMKESDIKNLDIDKLDLHISNLEQDKEKLYNQYSSLKSETEVDLLNEYDKNRQVEIQKENER